jgi:hypothetical protein
LGHPGLTAHRFTHPTETDDRVHAYLESIFHKRPFNRVEGADLEIDGVTIEVKSCREWKKANPEHCNGARRRRGHFTFHGTEDADFVLFVLVFCDGGHCYKLPPLHQVWETFGLYVRTINWSLLFDAQGLQHRRPGELAV